MDINARVSSWKDKLLDLGHRNKLLNYRKTARSALIVTEPGYEVLFNELVRSEQPLTFPRVPVDEDEDEEEKEEDTADHSEMPVVLDEIPSYGNHTSPLYTNHTVRDLQKTLRSIRNKAKTFQEEQGINVLYLCFGFLQWTEADASKMIYSAPLILVPVSLAQKSIAAPFTVMLHEDEIVVNPTLAYKLSNDFGITLPELDENKNLDVFFDAVSAVTGRRDRSVTKDVALGLFSFLKINMVKDITNHAKSIAEHPVVRALAGDNSGLSHVLDDISDYDFDANDKPENVFQIVDADASQQEAILMAKKGHSFVLQGPPGTGKSQTITNIIAESLAQGKKVLFVSEKMAALDVVYRRLSAAGLGDFCLVLHSHKTNKKAVLEQLAAVCALSGKRSTITDDAYAKLSNLESDKKKLNEYARQLFTRIDPLGRTIFEANGAIANLENTPDLIFPIPSVRNISREQFNQYLNCLREYVSMLGKATMDYRENPWRNTSVTALTNELRHDIASRLNPLSENLREICKEKLPGLFEEICSVYPSTINGISRAIDMLPELDGAHMVPVEWITDGIDKSVVDNLTKYVFMCNEYNKSLQKLTDYYQILASAELLDYVTDDELRDPDIQTQQCEQIEQVIDSDPLFNRWKKNGYESARSLLSEAKKQSDMIAEVRDTVLKTYDDGIFDTDADGMLRRFKSEYTSVLKAVKKEYKEDRKFFLAHMLEYGRKLRDDEIVDALQKIKKAVELSKWYAQNNDKLAQYFGDMVCSENSAYPELEKKLNLYYTLIKTKEALEHLNKYTVKITADDEYLRKTYGPLYQGTRTDWEGIHNAYNWAVRFGKTVSQDHLSPLFVKKICTVPGFVDRCGQIREELAGIKQAILPDILWFSNLFDSDAKITDVPLGDLQKQVSNCAGNIHLLEEYLDYREAYNTCIDIGLSEFMQEVEKNGVPADQIMPAYKKRFFRLWLDAVEADYPAVQQFRRYKQDSTIKEFRQLDTLQFDIAKARIRSGLINQLPSLDHMTNGVDEISVLKRELAKETRHMPLRKLFNAIPNLMTRLKPCLMMSPLTVSLFLESEEYKFDLVVFDEASQVYTENAIGAISRGKQVIIAGDSKQLPPTNFFKAAVSEESFDSDDEDDDEEYMVFDSILEEANGLPERTLRWHYRSRHESLIAFSNAKIYKNQLITFPSNIETGKDVGVEYIYVPNGFYDRGGKKGNVPEAEKIADMVFDHIRSTPDRSLGVITFGEVQQIAVENALRQKRLENLQFEEFFNEDKEEPFFIKNLENVQGDERDTIIFSIGYAPDAKGVFRMNFGPLSKSGGERRLNVAITRAKYNIKLVGSIQPYDINVDKINAEGPKLLRGYIDYAMNGPSVLENIIEESDTVDFDSPFEQAVYNFLDRAGYKLVTQVGCSGYRIDIGVRHPDFPGMYVLGVECDGASYHSSRTARERDRLRQDVLEKMGWKIYRIWSTDWIKDPAAEGNRLLAAVKNAIRTFDSGSDIDAMVTSAKPASSGSQFMEVESRADAQGIDNLYGFEKFRPTPLYKVNKTHNPIKDIQSYIRMVVEYEYPVHYDIVCQRIANALDSTKVTATIRRDVDLALTGINDIRRTEDNFFLPRQNDGMHIRLPNDRKIQHIHVGELATAMFTILQNMIGTNRKGLTDETARVYGFSRTGANIAEAMEKAIDFLLEKGLIEEVNEKLLIRKHE